MIVSFSFLKQSVNRPCIFTRLHICYPVIHMRFFHNDIFCNIPTFLLLVFLGLFERHSIFEDTFCDVVTHFLGATYTYL